MSLAVEDYVRGTTIPRIYPIILRSKNPVDEVIRDDDNVMTKNIFYNDINIQSHPVAIFSSKFGRLNYEADFLAVEPAYWASMAEISATPGQPDSTSTSNSIDYRQILLEAIDYMNAAKSQSVEPSSDGEVEDVPDVTGQLLDMDFICDEQS